jgi:ABC-type polysaccharide/polyol phosphate transport system ATPase subunit
MTASFDEFFRSGFQERSVHTMQKASTTSPFLRMEAIVKRFGGNVAVNNVTIAVMPGSVLALLGENGAGKSTLIKVLAGVYHGDTCFSPRSTTEMPCFPAIPRAQSVGKPRN